MSAITRRISEFVAATSFEDLPQEVRERAKALMMDSVGIAVRARNEAPATPSLLGAVARLGLAHGKASVFGDEARYAPPGAAFLNGALIHSLDFDDTHARGSIHSSAPIVPAALAAAEMTGAGGRDVIAAVVAGYEVQIRLSLALVPKDHYLRGFHPTATCGAFGAAAAAARVLGLSADQVASAFGVCLSQAAGSLQFLVRGGWTKPFQVGYAAMNGLIAATLAAEGFRGANEAIEGKAGFLRSYAPDPVMEKATEGLGETWETLALAVKPYPCCRYAHAALDALIELRDAHHIEAGDIESVEIGLPRTGWNVIGDPEDDKHRPANVIDCQFSMPFVGAVALREGRLAWDDYAPHLEDDETLSLCGRIHTVVDARAEAEFPAHMSGVARVETGHGRFEKFVAVARGEPENFVSPAELRAKFDGLAGPYLDDARRDALAAALLALDQAREAGSLFRLTRPGKSAALRVAAGEK